MICLIRQVFETDVYAPAASAAQCRTAPLAPLDAGCPPGKAGSVLSAPPHCLVQA